MIYLVEDNSLKAAKIVEFLKESLPEFFVSKVLNSYQTGLRAIEEDRPNIVLLDMTLPNFDRKPNTREGRIRPLGGYEILRKMQLKNIKSKVIVITQLESFGDGKEEVSFEEITSRCVRDFPDLFFGSVYFDQSGLEWQSSLKKLLFNLIRILPND